MRMLTLALTALLLSGCAYSDHARHWVGALHTGMQVNRANAEPLTVPMHFSTGVCSADPRVEASIWLTDLSEATLAQAPPEKGAPLENSHSQGTLRDGQAMHVELLFSPRPGYTPLDSTATNIAIRYIIFSRGEVGIYEGGGYGYPIGSIESGSMSLRIENATLSLGAHTSGFVDLLTPATLSGTFNGPRDDAKAELIRDGLDQAVSAALGRQTYVHLPKHSEPRSF
ncbi:MAG: hypothetical protein MK101_10975 [Phycisphaerales bacterium]|nr:hypothetical protein [Phycisphaerales bacterium]